MAKDYRGVKFPDRPKGIGPNPSRTWAEKAANNKARPSLSFPQVNATAQGTVAKFLTEEEKQMLRETRPPGTQHPLLQTDITSSVSHHDPDGTRHKVTTPEEGAKKLYSEMDERLRAGNIALERARQAMAREAELAKSMILEDERNEARRELALIKKVRLPDDYAKETPEDFKKRAGENLTQLYDMACRKVAEALAQRELEPKDLIRLMSMAGEEMRHWRDLAPAQQVEVKVDYVKNIGSLAAMRAKIMKERADDNVIDADILKVVNGSDE
jgi:hypothetical protein